MSNTVGELIATIKYRTGKTAAEIAKEIGYTREHLTRAKNSDAPMIIGALREKFAAVLDPKPDAGLSSMVSVLVSRVAELIAEKTGRDVSIELQRLKQDAEYLAKQRADGR